MLKLENVSKYYYSSTSVVCALRKINLEFNIGEFVAITGESGSGKTTLINILSGLDSYEDGEFYYNNNKTSFFDSEDWEKYRKNEIAFIFQNYNLIDSFTVLENVIVSYIIDGYSYSEAKNKAKETLKLVGLEKDYHKKATKLSGVQKQRLSIARALAKETNIIVADEPTGNLDAENGKAILELLKKVSKNKLVIVVSHNLSEIEPYMTRKIRLHDGEVALDEVVIKNNNEKTNIISKTNDDTKDVKKVFNFSYLNIKSQPKKTLLMLLLVLICVFSSFVLYANFKSNIDDNKTKTLETDFFLNFDETRLIVKKSDNSIITEEDLDKANVKKVKSIEKYDYITDVNYYRLGDYKWILAGGLGEPKPDGSVNFIDSSSIKLMNNNKYIRSASSLNENDLASGRLPNNMLEMVIYSNDPDIIGKKELVLFKNTRKWGLDSYLKYNIEIVGVLKENTNQAYFSDDLCRVLEISEQNLDFNIEFRKNKGNLTRFKFTKLAVDPTLEGVQVCVSEAIRNALSHHEVEIPDNYLKIRCNYIDKYYNFPLNLKVKQDICEEAIVFSIEAFNQLYKDYNSDTQFAVFIDDYSYTDDVMRRLSEEGFVSISCFRSSVSGYDVEKVVIRYVNLGISVISLFIINLLVIIIGLSILKVKRNDYLIFKMIGLTNKLIKKINNVELIFYGIVANIVLIITFLFVNSTTTNQLIIDILKYIKFYDFMIVLLISLLSMFLLAKRFNKFIVNKTKITVLKEE